MDRVRGFLWILLSVALLVGCKTVSYMPVTRQVHDSVRIVVRNEIIYVKDTAYIEIPAQKAERITKDTISNLENDYAVSCAWVTSDGMLHHTLETKPQTKPYVFDKPIIRNDSTYKESSHSDNTQTVTVEVERKLTWWQRTQIYGFWVLMALVSIGLIWKYRSLITTTLGKLI